MNKTKLKTYSLGLMRERIEYYMLLIIHYLQATEDAECEDLLIAEHKIKKLRIRLKRAITVFLETEYEDDHYDSYKGNHIEWLNDELIKLGQHSNEFLHLFVKNIVDPSLMLRWYFIGTYGDTAVHVKI